MLLRKERELIVAYGKKLITHGLTRGTGGNLSICNQRKGVVAISPSGLDYFAVEPDDIVVVDMNSRVVTGDRKPSSELNLHMIFYRKRDDIHAIVHTHSPCATALSCLRKGIPPIHYLVGYAGKNVKCAAYATFGTIKLAENAFKAMTDRKAVLLANHGLLAGGETMEEAFYIAEMIEFCAELYCNARAVGPPLKLSDKEMNVIQEKLKTYGK